MERKIGEIFEHGGIWYQCVEEYGCDECIFRNIPCDALRDIRGECMTSLRSDAKKVCFKKLEKVGNPYEYNGKTWQPYKSPIPIEIIPSNLMYKTVRYDFIEIEIKQNQENMEENKLNLKPFDLEAAKLGKPVCTRDGRKARIICFDMKGDICPMVAAVEENGVEYLYRYDEKGLNCYKKSNEDLMMLPEKKEGWINIVKTEAGGYCCKGEEVHSDYNDAILENINVLDKRGIIVKIEWEE